MLFHLGIFTINFNKKDKKENIEAILNLKNYERNYEQSKHDLLSNFGMYR